MIYMLDAKKHVLQVVLRRIGLEGTTQMMDLGGFSDATSSIGYRQGSRHMVTTIPSCASIPLCRNIHQGHYGGAPERVTLWKRRRRDGAARRSHDTVKQRRILMKRKLLCLALAAALAMACSRPVRRAANPSPAPPRPQTRAERRRAPRSSPPRVRWDSDRWAEYRPIEGKEYTMTIASNVMGRWTTKTRNHQVVPGANGLKVENINLDNNNYMEMLNIRIASV